MQAEVKPILSSNSGTLSVCMIVRNEELFLPRCLQSIKNVADEIIVIDTGSTDQTPDIAKSYGAKVISVEWKNDFAAARNISLQNASCAWILWLDADDIVPELSLSQIRFLKSGVPDRVFGCIVRNQRPGNTGSEFVQARMFPNRKDIYFERSIHEQMMPSALRLGLKLDVCQVVIEHHGYADPETLKKKAKRNIEMLLREFESHGADPVMAVEIGDSYQLVEEYDCAEIWYKRVLASSECKVAMPAISGQAYLGLGNCCQKKGKFEDAIAFFKEALQLSPWRSDVYYNMAVAFEMAGFLDEAVASLHQVLKIKPQPGQVGVDFRAAQIKTYLRLVRILIEQGKTDELPILIEGAVRAFPERPEIHNVAGKYFLKTGKLIESLRAFEKSVLIIREGNSDAYIGLCLIYRIAGMMHKVEETIQAVEHIFINDKRFLVFRCYLHDEVQTIMGKDEFDKILNDLKREFYNTI